MVKNEIKTIEDLKAELSAEWNKPKRKDKTGKVVDNREPRSYKTIADLQDRINEIKNRR